MGIKNFFKNAFDDMKESAKAQHEVDKANWDAARAESKAQWEEAKAIGNPNRRKAVFQAERDICKQIISGLANVQFFIHNI